jgi:hypothetical protein
MATAKKNQSREIALTVQRLLGVGSFNGLVSYLIDRICLPGGGFESHEFGKQEHSTASGAGVLIGLAGIPAIRDDVIAPLANELGSLITDNGIVTGHDSNPGAPSTSWREAQVLLGLLIRPSLSRSIWRKAEALATRLIKEQDLDTGGWSLREGEEAQLLFGFYPTLALIQAWRLGLIEKSSGAAVLSRASSYLVREVHANKSSLEEQLLALHALRVLCSTLPRSAPLIHDIADLRIEKTERAWSFTQGLTLVDRPVVVHRQPIWHAIVWRPLLYLAVRGVSPATPLQALLGHELASTFDGDISAWHGPVATTQTQQGVSWASALALRGTYALAQDLVSWRITVPEWLERGRQLTSAQYEFDVAISFAGNDRIVAAQISDELKRAGYRVFYDRDYQHALLGEDLTEYLQDTYFRRSRFAVVVISQAFRESKWAGQWEWKAVLARMQDQRGAYLLPYVIEDISLPGFNKTLGYVSHRNYTPTQFAALVVRKLRESV